MGESNAERRRRYFARYAANLALYRAEESEGRFGCPICCHYYDAASVESARIKQPAVNLAHVYPESCQGNVAVLTCRACNSRFGRRYDQHMALSHKHWAHFESPEDVPSLPASISIKADELKIDVRWTPEGMHIVLPSRGNRSDALRRAQAAMIAGEQFKLVVPTVNSDAYRLVTLQAAWLLLFYWYGYEYLLSSDTEWVRELLQSDEASSFVLPSIECAEGGVEPILFTAGVAEVHGLRVACAVIPSSTKQIKARFVFLPGPGAAGSADWEKVVTIFETTPERTLAAMKYEPARFSPNERLMRSRGLGYFAWCWHYFGVPNEERHESSRD